MGLSIYEPLTVLLVEDSADDEQLALRALRSCGIPILVKVARDGARAIELLGIDEQNEPRTLPHLIVCDLKLPKLSGSEVLDRVKRNKRTAGVPFVIFSSSDLETDVAKCSRLGANSYVRKPVDYQQFVDAVRQIAGRWLGASPTGRSTPPPRIGLSAPTSLGWQRL